MNWSSRGSSHGAPSYNTPYNTPHTSHNATKKNSSSLHQRKRRHLALKSRNSPSPQSRKKKGWWGSGGWAAESTPLQNLAMRTALVLISVPIGNKFGGIINRTRGKLEF
eukprot:1150778-Pelagomonas_calceolata.AAC.2